MKIVNNPNLGKLNTLRINTNGSALVEVGNITDLDKVRELSSARRLPIVVLGEGSNVLIDDKGIKGIIVKLTNKKLNILNEDSEQVTLKADGGMRWDDLVLKVSKNNWQGVECLSGIPGTVGAAPVQNIGAYGQEIKNVFIELEAYDTKTGKVKIFSKIDCEFGYRDSIFKRKRNKGRYIIFSVTIKLLKNGKPCFDYESLKNYLQDLGINSPSVMDVRKAVLDIRKVKLEDPNEVGTAGSFFKNPIVGNSLRTQLIKTYPGIPIYQIDKGRFKIPAAWLIEKAGWKGLRKGEVGISPKHALILVNYGNASSGDVKEFAENIIDDIHKKFGVDLEPEVQFL